MVNLGQDSSVSRPYLNFRVRFQAVVDAPDHLVHGHHHGHHHHHHAMEHLWQKARGVSSSEQNQLPHVMVQAVVGHIAAHTDAHFAELVLDERICALISEKRCKGFNNPLAMLPCIEVAASAHIRGIDDTHFVSNDRYELTRRTYIIVFIACIIIIGIVERLMSQHTVSQLSQHPLTMAPRCSGLGSNL